MKCRELKCEKCNRSAHECSGWLARVNPGELPSRWKCMPGCESLPLTNEAALLGAIEDVARAAP